MKKATVTLKNGKVFYKILENREQLIKFIENTGSTFEDDFTIIENVYDNFDLSEEPVKFDIGIRIKDIDCFTIRDI